MAGLGEQTRQCVRERRFSSDAIDEAGGNCDCIVIDRPSNPCRMTQSALSASDHHTVAAIPDHLSTIGSTALKEKVHRMNERMTNATSVAGLKKKGCAEFGAVLPVRVRIGGQVLTTARADRMEEVRSSFDLEGMMGLFEPHGGRAPPGRDTLASFVQVGSGT